MRSEDSENRDFMGKKYTCGRWRGVKFQNSVSEPGRCRGVVAVGRWSLLGSQYIGKWTGVWESGRYRGVVAVGGWSLRGGPLYYTNHVHC